MVGNDEAPHLPGGHHGELRSLSYFYFYLVGNNPVWPPNGVPLPQPVLAIGALLLVIVAAVATREFIAGNLPNEPEHLVDWIVNPQAIEPGTAMPTLGVSPDEARDMAAYLFTLRDPGPP